MMNPLRLLRAALAASLFCVLSSAHAAETPNQPYAWKPVRMGGCGFVTGIVFHPSEKGLAYCRTDMGGAYRRDSETGEWIPLLDWVSLPDVNLMGVESIAVDPANPEAVYLACGTNSMAESPDGAILISKDRGRSFEVVRVPYKFGGNENGRGNGERMAVDPKNGRILFLGTRHDGLVKSVDGGRSWARVLSFPDVADLPPKDIPGFAERQGWLHMQAGSGVIRVIFAPGGASKDKSDNVFVAVSLAGRESVFESRDGGESWGALPGQPTKFLPTDMDLSPEGFLYLSYGTNPGPYPMTDGAVWRFDTRDGTWSDITPSRSGSHPGVEHDFFGYCSVAVDPEEPGCVIATPFWYVGGEELFRSLDGGTTWKPILRDCGNFDFSKIPYSSVPILHWLCDVEIDPFDRNHLIFTTGFGGMESFDLLRSDSAASKEAGSTWVPMMAGIEESVPLDMVAPPEGATLVTAVGDYGGFVHRDLDVFAPEGNFANPRFDNTTGLALAMAKPAEIVRVGTSWKGKTANIAFSYDGGKSWECGVNPDPEARNGAVALSADAATVVWTPDPVRKPGDWRVILRNYRPMYSTDCGKTWTQCAGLPENLRVSADKVNPLRFYAYDAFTRTFFESVDGARSFSSRRLFPQGSVPYVPDQRGDGRGGQDRVYAEPGREGTVWLALFDGLHEVFADGSLRRVPHVTELRAFAFGRAAPGVSRPAMYLVGVVDGVRGIFRSDDLGAHFVRINDDAHQWGSILLLEGDPNRYGRIYVGTHGRGAIYGDIAGKVEE